MFLGKLTNNEKVAFLELAHYVARSDGDFSVKQRDIILTYCFEMQIDDIDYHEDKFNLINTLGNFHSNKSRKIILLEIMALIYSDNIVHKEEEIIIDTIINHYGFNKLLSNLYLEWTKTILSVSKQGKLLIDL